MRFKRIAIRNAVLCSMFMGFLGLIWIALHCSKGDPQWSQEFSRQIFDTNLQSMKARELLIKRKEKYILEKLNILGVTNKDFFTETLPVIFIVTPTHTRLTQKAELTRMYQTLIHVPRLHWIVVEDSIEKTDLIKRFLERSLIPHTHLNVRTRNELIRREQEPRWLKNRGIDQRNLAIDWIRDNFDMQNGDGVVYFGDDDNTYDLRIFEMMRYTKKVSVWPIGLVGGLKWEGPVCKDGKVIRFHTDFKPERPLPLDMAGFAINVKLLIDNPDVEMDVYAERGYVESSIVGQLVKTQELEPLADNCKMILVWHTQTVTPKIKREKKLEKLNKGSDATIEV